MIRLIFVKIFTFIYRIIFKVTYLKFINSLDDPKKSQANTLQEILKIYNNSKISESKKCNNYDEYKQLPISEYGDIEKELLKGHHYPTKVEQYEKTSGSSGGNKLIPYSTDILKSFQRLFIIWSVDILENISFKNLTFYFSISPQFRRNSEENDYKTIESDKDYLGPLLKRIGSPFFVEIPKIKEVSNPRDFKMLLALYLISNRTLEIISIWSPSFLLELWSFIKDNEKEIIEHLKKGHYLKSWRFCPQVMTSINVKRAFPSLKFISSWGSVNAEVDYRKLEQLFENVIIQKKGLLATEAPMTVPIFKSKSFVPLIDEVFFEFIDKNDNIHLLHEIKVGEIYEIIISQKGGLYRYRVKDLIIVTNMYKNTPCFDFYGRNDSLSDLVGEKLHETDVSKAFKDTNARVAIPSSSHKRYIILSEKEIDSTQQERIKNLLNKNYHYHNSRKLNQLKEAEFLVVKSLSEKIGDFLEQRRGINKGDQKSSQLLYRESDDSLLCALLDVDQIELSSLFK